AQLSALAPSPLTDLADGLQVQLRAALADAGQEAANPGRIVLTAALADAPRAAAQGAVLTLLQEALQQVPQTGNVATANVEPRSAGANAAAPRAPTPPPPFRGGLPSPQPVAQPSIAPNAPLPAIAHRLLEATDSAIARQTLLQVASLPARV